MGRMQSILSATGTWLMSALVFLLPIFFIPIGWITIPHAKMIVVAVAVLLAIGAWALSRIASDGVEVPISFIALSALLLPVSYGVSALLSNTGVTSFVGVGTEVDTVVAMVLWVASLIGAMFLMRGTQVIHRIYWLLILAAGLIAAWHLVQVFLGDSIVSLGGFLTLPPASLVGSWHDLAIFLGLTSFFSTLYVVMPFATRIGSVVAIVSSIMSLALLVLINAQDVWIALALLSAVVALYILFFNRKHQKPAPQAQMGMMTQENPPQQPPLPSPVSVTAPVILAVVAVVFAFAGSFVYDRIPEQVRIAEFEVRPSWEGTFAVGSAVYQEKNLLFGSGPNTFTREWGKYKPAGVNETAFWNTDFAQGIGFIPTSLITAGLFAAFAWVLFLGMIFYRGIRSLFSSIFTIDKHWRLLLLAIFGGVVYLWAFHLTYAPGVTLLALTFILTGMFVAAQQSAGILRVVRIPFTPANTKGMISIVVITVGALAVIFSGFFLLRAVSADMLVNRSVVVYNTTNDVAQAQRVLGQAVVLDPNSKRVHRAGVELGLLEFQSIAQRGLQTSEDEQELRSVLEQAITHGLTAISIDESDYRSWITLARLYEELAGVQIQGAYENAQDAYERAIQESPTNPEPLVRLAQLSLSRGNVDDARTYLDLAIQRKQNFALAHFLKAQIERSEGNMQGAIASAQAAAASAPQEPVAWFQLGALNYDAGNYAEAATALEQAVILNGNYANALYVLGLAYFEIGRIGGSLAAFERVQELNPDNVEVLRILDNLRTGNAPLAEQAEE